MGIRRFTVALAVTAGCANNTVVVPEDGGTTSDGADESEGEPSSPPAMSTSGPADDGPLDTADDAETGPIEPAVCGDGIRNADEACDRLDFGGVSCEDLGASGGELRCNDNCTIDECECIWDDRGGCDPVCGDGIVRGNEDCDGSSFADPSEADCAVLLGSRFYGDVTCSACELDTSGCGVCGDGTLQPGFEVCDPAQTPGAVACADALGPAYGGETSCTPECEWEDTCVLTCGNGSVDGAEPCDGDDLAGATCQSEGFVGGALSCTAACALDTAQCHSCGDGVADPGEVCDGGDFDGTTCADFVPLGVGALACDVTCSIIDANACEPLVPQWDGEAIITEIMAASLAEPDQNIGEWIEVHNPSDMPFNLQGCTVTGSAPFEAFTVLADVPIPPGAYVTLGKGPDDALGFTPDFYLPAQVTLLNDGDSLAIECGMVVFDDVAYGDGGKKDDWPEFQPGVAIATTNAVLSAADNDDGSAWCSATNEYALMQLGTPGAANDCP